MNFEKEDQRIFIRDEEGHLLAEITFPCSNGVYCIEHTYVHDILKGQGIASTLVQMVLQEIQSKDGKVCATCNYANNWLEKHEEYHSMWIR